jgi:hypothetical protein
MEKIVSFELLELISKLHWATFQKTIIWLITAMATSRLMFVKNMTIEGNNFLLLTVTVLFLWGAFSDERTSPGHEPQMGLDTKTYWLTDRQSQCNFDFDFDKSTTPQLSDSKNSGRMPQMDALLQDTLANGPSVVT